MSRDAPLLDLPPATAGVEPAPEIPTVLALLPVRRIVLFPGLIVTLTVMASGGMPARSAKITKCAWQR